MPVERDPEGNRFVQAEAEVPGTPEQVWNAISSGPGISSWFVPTQLDGRVGGKIVCNFGRGMDSTAPIPVGAPPRRFVAENPAGERPDDPTIADEWTVEALGGGTCRVR